MQLDKQLDSLNAEFARGDQLRFEPGCGNLPKAVVQTADATTELYLHGAHLTAYQPTGQKPVLFVSDKSWFEPDKPIRGGVPICLPWFADQTDTPNAPMHGFARLMPWKIDAVSTADPEATTLALSLTDNSQTRAFWPYAFQARYIVTVGKTLAMRLEMTNDGDKPFTFTEAMHTYLHVGDVRRIRISGLQHTSYIDKLQNAARQHQGPNPITISAETDRIYLDTPSACMVDDPVLARRVVIDKAGSATTVVWNPWIDKSKRMPDFGDDEWPSMLCIETCNVADHAIHLPPGQTHAIEARLRVDPM